MCTALLADLRHDWESLTSEEVHALQVQALQPRNHGQPSPAAAAPAPQAEHAGLHLKRS